jgi:Ca2+-transporting ATPase
MAGEGLRVIGVARSAFSEASLPVGQHDFTFEFMGLIGLADPVRPGVPEAIRECFTAGIRVIMITGDYPVTAQNIASDIGLKNCKEVITGPELEKKNSGRGSRPSIFLPGWCLSRSCSLLMPLRLTVRLWQ